MFNNLSIFIQFEEVRGDVFINIQSKLVGHNQDLSAKYKIKISRNIILSTPHGSHDHNTLVLFLYRVLKKYLCFVLFIC
jgi:hypothetical protein